MKASEKAVINSNYHYLIIPDTEIKAKTFNTIFFEIPQSNKSNMCFRIIQASKPYQIEKIFQSWIQTFLLIQKIKMLKRFHHPQQSRILKVVF